MRSRNNLPSLYRWSIDHPELFWSEVWSFCGVLSSRKWDRVVDDVTRMPGASWFAGARLNFAQNLLRYRDDHPAIVGWNESGRHQVLTFSELFRRSAGFAAALREAGVKSQSSGFLPGEAVQHMTVPEGFRVELVAVHVVRAVVAGVSQPVPIDVGLGRVGDAGTVVHLVKHAVVVVIDRAAAVVNEYAEAGFSDIDLDAGPQDHLAVELKYLALLALREAEACDRGDVVVAGTRMRQQREFLDRHMLAWVPRWAAELARYDPLPLFSAMAEMIEHSVAQASRELAIGLSFVRRVG